MYNLHDNPKMSNNIWIFSILKINYLTNTIWHHLYMESRMWHKWTYLQNRNRLRDMETDLWLPRGRQREQDGLGICGRYMQTITFSLDKQWGPIVQHRELHPISWDRTWRKILREKECTYMYDWVTMLYSINWYNTVNQLYSNKNKVPQNNNKCLAGSSHCGTVEMNSTRVHEDAS